MGLEIEKIERTSQIYLYCRTSNLTKQTRTSLLSLITGDVIRRGVARCHTALLLTLAPKVIFTLTLVAWFLEPHRRGIFQLSILCFQLYHVALFSVEVICTFLLWCATYSSYSIFVKKFGLNWTSVKDLWEQNIWTWDWGSKSLRAYIIRGLIICILFHCLLEWSKMKNEMSGMFIPVVKMTNPQ